MEKWGAFAAGPELTRARLRRIVYKLAREDIEAQRQPFYGDPPEKLHDHLMQILFAVLRGVRQTMRRHEVVELWKGKVRETKTKIREAEEAAKKEAEAVAEAYRESFVKQLKVDDVLRSARTQQGASESKKSSRKSTANVSQASEEQERPQFPAPWDERPKALSSVEDLRAKWWQLRAKKSKTWVSGIVEISKTIESAISRLSFSYNTSLRGLEESGNNLTQAYGQLIGILNRLREATEAQRARAEKAEKARQKAAERRARLAQIARLNEEDEEDYDPANPREEVRVQRKAGRRARFLQPRQGAFQIHGTRSTVKSSVDGSRLNTPRSSCSGGNGGDATGSGGGHAAAAGSEGNPNGGFVGGGAEGCDERRTSGSEDGSVYDSENGCARDGCARDGSRMFRSFRSGGAKDGRRDGARGSRDGARGSRDGPRGSRNGARGYRGLDGASDCGKDCERDCASDCTDDCAGNNAAGRADDSADESEGSVPGSNGGYSERSSMSDPLSDMPTTVGWTSERTLGLDMESSCGVDSVGAVLQELQDFMESQPEGSEAVELFTQVFAQACGERESEPSFHEAEGGGLVGDKQRAQTGGQVDADGQDGLLVEPPSQRCSFRTSISEHSGDEDNGELVGAGHRDSLVSCDAGSSCSEFAGVLDELAMQLVPPAEGGGEPNAEAQGHLPAVPDPLGKEDAMSSVATDIVSERPASRDGANPAADLEPHADVKRDPTPVTEKREISKPEPLILPPPPEVNLSRPRPKFLLDGTPSSAREGAGSPGSLMMPNGWVRRASETPRLEKWRPDSPQSSGGWKIPAPQGPSTKRPQPRSSGASRPLTSNTFSSWAARSMAMSEDRLSSWVTSTPTSTARQPTESAASSSWPIGQVSPHLVGGSPRVLPALDHTPRAPVSSEGSLSFRRRMSTPLPARHATSLKRV